MASPISFGDAFLMAKLAWTLAQAFTQGRKSAPAEFREVENQLYSLSTALEAFKKACDERGSAAPAQDSNHPSSDGIIRKIMENCNETLRNLEAIVNKYGEIVQDAEAGQTCIRRWKKSMIKDFRKIAWTTEKGDLATLRSQLMVHTNSLDLLMGVILNSQATRIEDIIRKHSTMLEQIHAWMDEGLRNMQSQAIQVNNNTHQGEPANYLSLITFKISVETSNGHQLVCDQATLDRDWGISRDPRYPSVMPLFECRCDVGRSSDGPTHKKEVTDYRLSNLTFAFRMAGTKRSWVLYKIANVSSNQLVSLIIQNIPPDRISEFEETFVTVLSETRASFMLHNGVSNMLAYVSSNNQREHVLNLRSDTKDTHLSLQSISFAVGHKTYTREVITGVALLHYKMVEEVENLAFLDVARTSRSMCDYAEITVNYAEVQGDITRSVIQLKRNTPVKLLDDQISLLLSGAQCLGYVNDTQTSNIDNADIKFDFTSVQAAKNFRDKLEAMKMELFIWSLQPQPDESVALHLYDGSKPGGARLTRYSQTAQVQCESIFMNTAEIFILHKKEQYRLLIVSRNKCTILSQVLANDFFSSPNSSNFQSPTYLVQIEGGGESKVYSYPKGFRYMRFQETQAEQMFQLGRLALT
ncbi:hypothetical protein B0I35DRAFT_512743 [Stachybotrys elegans]|uniref:NACHT-NTPase and P-loop NTPases N-terminal domain-containing protein n=1 Tax=Stachybotrys elegans TaxID=80388 RepID=A0A8K0SQD0_9HYPO|nr:hypothetical protein B0I35DRAFT_512743 [Stachybotrys elegans]